MPKIIVSCKNILIQEIILEAIRASDSMESVSGWRSPINSESLQSIGEEVFILCCIGIENTELSLKNDLPILVTNAPMAKVILITDVEESAKIRLALELGAKGYIGMNSSFDITLAAIRLVWAGGNFVPAYGLGEATKTSVEQKKSVHLRRTLTGREMEILACLKNNQKNKTISRILNIKESTVSVHVRNIVVKLGLRNRFEVVEKLKDMDV